MLLSKEVALKISKLLSTEAENELVLILDDVIAQETSKMNRLSTPDALKEIAVIVDFCRRLKEYRKRIEDVVKDGRYNQ